MLCDPSQLDELMRKYRIIEYKVMTRGVNYYHCDKKYQVQYRWFFIWLGMCDFDDRDTAESWIEAIKELGEFKNKVVWHD
jgi:hypothetical protein